MTDKTQNSGQKANESPLGTIPAPEAVPESVPENTPEKDEDFRGQEQPTQEQPTQEQPTEELNGRKGPDPTRYGDWEKNGRCIDF